MKALYHMFHHLTDPSMFPAAKPFRSITEIINAKHLFSFSCPQNAKNRIILHIHGPCKRIGGKYFMLHADLFHPAQTIKDTVLDSSLLLDLLCQLPVKLTSVDITGILCLLRILFIMVIV